MRRLKPRNPGAWRTGAGGDRRPGQRLRTARARFTLTTASPEQIARGRYLAVAGDCAACQTRPGGAPFAGGRAVLTPFGAVFSTNPDARRQRPARLDADQFHRALHQGVQRVGAVDAWEYGAGLLLHDQG